MLFCSVLHTAAHPTGSVSEAERHVCLMSLLTRSDCVYFVFFFFPFHCLCAIVNIFHLDCAVDSESARGCRILNAAAVRFL